MYEFGTYKSDNGLTIECEGFSAISPISVV